VAAAAGAAGGQGDGAAGVANGAGAGAAAVAAGVANGAATAGVGCVAAGAVLRGATGVGRAGEIASGGAAGVGLGAGIAAGAAEGVAAKAGVRGAAADGAGAAGTSAKSALGAAVLTTRMIPPHTEQRARTPDSGTFAGSTRKTLRHSGQLTFINPLQAGRPPATRAPSRVPTHGRSVPSDPRRVCHSTSVQTHPRRHQFLQASD